MIDEMTYRRHANYEIVTPQRAFSHWQKGYN